MPKIDVSILLSDPDFVEKVELITRLASFDEHGVVHFTETPKEIIACVQGENGSMLEKQPQSALLHDNINIWSKEVFEAETPDGYSNIIVWNGLRYQVKEVMYYKNYGRGYTKASCELEPEHV